MNRALPPGDSGNQITTSSRTPRHRRFVPGPGRLVWRTSASAGGARVGHRSAVGAPVSRGARLPVVCGQGDVCRASSAGIGDKKQKARRGRSRAGLKGAD